MTLRLASQIRRTMTSIATLERLPAAAVAKLLLAEQEAATNPTIAVVDVRDDGAPLSSPLPSMHPIFSPLPNSPIPPSPPAMSYHHAVPSLITSARVTV